MATKILVIEDESNIRELLKDNLEYEGYEVYEAEDGETALKMVKESNYDLIILDLMLPKLNGYEFLKGVRKFDRLIPIIILSAKSEEIDKIKGFDLGADDYLTKPFQIRELLSRIKAVLRRSSKVLSDMKTFSFENFVLDFDKGVLYKDGKPVDISYYEFEILKYLIYNKNKPVTREEIIDSIWKADGSISPRNIDTHIVSLRKLIEKDPEEPKYIKTVFRIGYKFEI
jgi:two-component system alkaline phosphatase synthesis response regulator PhoP